MANWNGSITEISPGPSFDTGMFAKMNLQHEYKMLNSTFCFHTVEELVPFIQANAFTACHLYSSVPMGTGAATLFFYISPNNLLISVCF
jgi:hypothetical protein